MIEAIKKQSKKGKQNFTEDLLELYEESYTNNGFDEFCYLLPGTINDNDYIHTINNITVLEIFKETKLL